MDDTQSTHPTELNYADFGSRAGASLVDGLLAIGLALLNFMFDLVIRVPILQWGLVLALYAYSFMAAFSFLALWGQTPGRCMLGLRVITPTSGNGGIGWKAAILRWLGGYLSMIALCLGYFAVLRDPERQAWHDKMAGTHVIRVTPQQNS